MHSSFSPDASDSPDALCRRALGLGFQEIAITDHAEWMNGSNGFPRAAQFFSAIERCRAWYEPMGLRIYAGIELGNPHDFPQEVARLLAEYPFDLTIASLHWLGEKNIHLEECFSGRSPDQVYADYFKELGRMAAQTDHDIIAHFDRILMRGSALGLPFEARKLESTVRDALGVVVAKGKALELNTCYLDHRPHWQQALVTMLTWYRQLGGERIVVNSDAHKAIHIGRNFDIARMLLTAAGLHATVRITPRRELPLPPVPRAVWGGGAIAAD